MDLPAIVPLFPLPRTVLFPGVPLPLHVFEPRYRKLVRDAVAGAELVGIVMLRGDWEANYHQQPEIFQTGTVGRLTQVEERADGRFDIVLLGMREFHIEGEREPAPYRTAAVRWGEPVGGELAPALRQRLESAVARFLATGSADVRGAARRLLADKVLPDSTRVNFLAHGLDITPLETQALLEEATLADRAARLCDSLEFGVRAREAASAGGRGSDQPQ